MGNRNLLEDSKDLIDRDKENKNYFDKWSSGYDRERISPWFQYTQKLALSQFRILPDSKLLDIGCGTGFAVRHVKQFLPKGMSVGIDLSYGMVGQAKQAAERSQKNKIHFIQASSESIPFQSDFFDHILCTNSFHHYPNPVKVLEEMKRVLKPGGQIVILENATDLSWYTWLWDKVLRIIEKGHVRYYTSQELGGFLKGAQFNNVKLCYLKNEFLKFGKLFASIQIWSGQSP